MCCRDVTSSSANLFAIWTGGFLAVLDVNTAVSHIPKVGRSWKLFHKKRSCAKHCQCGFMQVSRCAGVLRVGLMKICGEEKLGSSPYGPSHGLGPVSADTR